MIRQATLIFLGCFYALCLSTTAAADEISFQSIVTKPRPAIIQKNVTKYAVRDAKIVNDPSIELQDCSDVTISYCELRSIKLSGCKRIRVFNCWIHDSTNNGVSIEECSDIIVQGNRIELVSSGVYARKSTGLQVIGNYVEDVVGPMPRGQMVQFNQVYGKENVVRSNSGLNHLGKSKPEDMISVYKSDGAADSPITIENNYLMGDPTEGSTDKSKSGSGMMLGDGGGSNILCRKNILINPGQCGIGVAGGSNITVEENTVIGRQSNVSNVGIYAWNQSKADGGKVIVRSNRVAWTNKEGAWNSWWKGDGFPDVLVEENQFQASELFEHLPEPPSIAPIPPVPYGKPVQFPWKKKR